MRNINVTIHGTLVLKQKLLIVLPLASNVLQNVTDDLPKVTVACSLNCTTKTSIDTWWLYLQAVDLRENIWHKCYIAAWRRTDYVVTLLFQIIDGWIIRFFHANYIPFSWKLTAKFYRSWMLFVYDRLIWSTNTLKKNDKAKQGRWNILFEKLCPMWKTGEFFDTRFHCDYLKRIFFFRLCCQAW